MPDARDHARECQPDQKNGIVLPSMNSIGRIGVTMICSSVPTSRSRTTANDVKLTTITNVSVRDDAWNEEPAAVEVRIVPWPRLERDRHGRIGWPRAGASADPAPSPARRVGDDR